MAYSDFKNLKAVCRQFNLTVDEQPDLFAAVPSREPSAKLTDWLQETIPLALAIDTEKSRSELIIAPVLLEIRRQVQPPISLFSGNEFNIDPAQGLVGRCDYLLSRSPEQLTLNAPVFAIAEAQNENIKAGLGQCLAAMVAAQRFNEQEQNAIATIHGAVTTGEIWKFLKLTEAIAAIDLMDYYISRDTAKILGILAAGVG